MGRKKLARWTGLEPATPGVTGRYSNQLSYHRALDRGDSGLAGGRQAGNRREPKVPAPLGEGHRLRHRSAYPLVRTGAQSTRPAPAHPARPRAGRSSRKSSTGRFLIAHHPSAGASRPPGQALASRISGSTVSRRTPSRGRGRGSASPDPARTGRVHSAPSGARCATPRNGPKMAKPTPRSASRREPCQIVNARAQASDSVWKSENVHRGHPPEFRAGRGRLARWTGLEPATPGVTGRYSNQLSYHRALRGGLDGPAGAVNGGRRNYFSGAGMNS